MDIQETIKSFKKVYPSKKVEGYWKTENGFILLTAKKKAETDNHYFVDHSTVRVATYEEVKELFLTPPSIYEDPESKYKGEIINSIIIFPAWIIGITVIYFLSNRSLFSILFSVKFYFSISVLWEIYNLIANVRLLKGGTEPKHYARFKKYNSLYWVIGLILDQIVNVLIFSHYH